MKTLIVNASSKSKREYVEETFSYSSKPFHSQLSKNHSSALIAARENLLEQVKISIGPDIAQGIADPKDDEYLPAFLRYSGRTYSKITDAAWRSLTANNNYDLIILSALYGLVGYNDPVRNYQIRQDTKLIASTIGNFWRDAGAKDWLLNYIENGSFKRVYFVLSTSYSKIIQKDNLIKELTDMGIQAEDKQMVSKGMVSMLERGSFINNFLLS
ncbi:MAG: YaaA family protein [Candidatus Heimdallarchaeota archaeon]|nr:YaaA family protein [Candidatus Heimdallarchaeota archaeon]MDH5646248.1 YaaA family protein [Candidatus Heimdallarchaeota archaeon]